MTRTLMTRTVALILLLTPVFAPAQDMNKGVNQDLPFVNWENAPVHPLDLSPDGTTLVLANTPDNRLEVFDVTTGVPKLRVSIPVGVEPVSARFRDNTQVWVVNHLSDSVSIVDLTTDNVIATLDTDDEPYDIVFAGSPLRAFVSCSQANTVLRFNPANLDATPARIAIGAEDPRALAVSPDGQFVYAAIFESGNGTTILGGGAESIENNPIGFPPNIVNDPAGPYGGMNPPPNANGGFEPPIGPLPLPPAVGLIVRQDEQGRWMDDNGGDWTALVSGPQANLSGRPVGWELLDRDIAIIDTKDLSVSYATRLMNIVMAIGVNPATGGVDVVGTDATNEIRFEPNVKGRFIRVNLGRVNGDGGKGANPLVDLNPHLTYQTGNVPQATRDLSLGDPRGIVWNSAGTVAYVSGMGSNNLVSVGADGARIGVVDVGQGPTGLALDESRDRLYVWNRFSGDISVVDTVAFAQRLRVAVFNPTPEVIRTGRAHFYGTHETSGLGHLACASCHVDGRMDRLAWDLGDPSGEVKIFNQNCQTDVQILGVDVFPCDDFHPMKGPMMTQTFQDIIGNEPFHWRGDRDGLEEFNGAFVGLQGDDAELSDTHMQEYEDFVATITFPPNPFRNIDNTLPTDLPLPGHFFVGVDDRTAGEPLPNGNAVNGLDLYMNDLRDDPFQCVSCHTLPSGMSANSPLLIFGIPIGGEIMPQGPNGENHLGIVSVDGSTNRHFKTPHLRNLYEKVGFDLTQQQAHAGFGFLHDGSVDSIVRFITEPAFEEQTGQDVADTVAFLLSFTGSDLPTDNPDILVPGPDSQDAHAAVGWQTTLDDEVIAEKGATLNEIIDLAADGAVGLIAKGPRDSENRGWVYNRDTDRFDSDRLAESHTLSQLTDQTEPGEAITFTVVPVGLGVRLGIDRDFDGVFDQDEKDQGSNPYDAASTKFKPRVGMWFNFGRPGHGMDLQLQGDVLFATWFTYNPDGTNTWYLAVAEFDFESMVWVGEMRSFRWPGPTSEVVGTLTLTFSDPETAKFEWDIDGETGSETFNYFVATLNSFTPANFTGHWFVPLESGYGFTVNMQGEIEFTLLYYYDGDGNPRWVLGSNETGGQINTLEMLSFTGFCPNCPTVDTKSVPAGTMTHEFSVLDPRVAIITTEITYPGAEGGTWNRSEVIIEPLSDPVN